jgi:hypothetical protein
MVTGFESDQFEVQKAIAHNLKSIAEQFKRFNDMYEKRHFEVKA